MMPKYFYIARAASDRERERVATTAGDDLHFHLTRAREKEEWSEQGEGGKKRRKIEQLELEVGALWSVRGKCRKCIYAKVAIVNAGAKCKSVLRNQRDTFTHTHNHTHTRTPQAHTYAEVYPIMYVLSSCAEICVKKSWKLSEDSYFNQCMWCIKKIPKIYWILNYYYTKTNYSENLNFIYWKVLH